MSDRNYYCSMKFRMMKIDTERNLTYNCDPAVPHQIDFNWLKQNPGQLFNTPLVIQERQQMLDNERNASCEQCCWAAEDVGAVSPRLLRQGYNKTHIDIVTNPEIIDLTIGSDCNLTCSYCLKEYSSAWRRDLITNGDYSTVTVDDDRYILNIKDKIIENVSQPNRLSTENYRLLLDEMRLMSNTLKTLIVTGGEPLLNNSLIEILDCFTTVPDIKVFTGLGVNIHRFSKIIAQLKDRSNVRIAISAETTEKFYEFNRYGVEWDDFLSKIEVLEKNNIRFEFHSTLSNLTILDFVRFYRKYKSRVQEFDLVYQPDFMAVYVLDDKTKDTVLKQFDELELEGKEHIVESLTAEPTDKQRSNIREFLKEFTRRRPNLDVTIYPNEFLDWMDYVV